MGSLTQIILSVQQLLLAAGDLTLAGMDLFNFSDPTGESELGFDWMHTIGLLERLKYLNRGANPVANRDRRFIWSPTRYTLRWGVDSPEGPRTRGRNTPSS